MSRLTDLISRAKAKDTELGDELEREFKILSARRPFGLNFERHRPESVELPHHPIRKGNKVRVLPIVPHQVVEYVRPSGAIRAGLSALQGPTGDLADLGLHDLVQGPSQKRAEGPVC